jgi:hypothetical protein
LPAALVGCTTLHAGPRPGRDRAIRGSPAGDARAAGRRGGAPGNQLYWLHRETIGSYEDLPALRRLTPVLPDELVPEMSAALQPDRAARPAGLPPGQHDAYRHDLRHALEQEIAEGHRQFTDERIAARHADPANLFDPDHIDRIAGLAAQAINRAFGHLVTVPALKSDRPAQDDQPAQRHQIHNAFLTGQMDIWREDQRRGTARQHLHFSHMWHGPQAQTGRIPGSRIPGGEGPQHIGPPHLPPEHYLWYDQDTGHLAVTSGGEAAAAELLWNHPALGGLNPPAPAAWAESRQHLAGHGRPSRRVRPAQRQVHRAGRPQQPGPARAARPPAATRIHCPAVRPSQQAIERLHIINEHLQAVITALQT